MKGCSRRTLLLLAPPVDGLPLFFCGVLPAALALRAFEDGVVRMPFEARSARFRGVLVAVVFDLGPGRRWAPLGGIVVLCVKFLKIKVALTGSIYCRMRF